MFYYFIISSAANQLNLWQFLPGIFITLTALLMGYAFGKRCAASKGKKEIKLYREFIQHLHRSYTEEDAYTILFNHLKKLPLDLKIFLYYIDDPDTGKWTTLTNSDNPACTAKPGECPLYKTGGCYKVADIQNTPHCHHLSPEKGGGSCFCINISGKEHIKSLLQIYSPNKNAFDPETMATLNAYIEITRLLVNNRRCFHLLNKKVHTDKLTGLYNRYFLDQFLENQIDASTLSGQPLSIIFIDIDNFKQVNDMYGHHAGDHLLSCFSDIVVKCLRKSDAMVRYGGDEFIIILPGTGATEAKIIVERIKNAINSTEIPEFEGIRLPNITCSFGISSYPDTAQRADELIRQADKALYMAKHNGSNNSCVYAGSYEH